MGKAIEIGQSLNLFSVLANNTSWDTLDSETIQRIINDPKGSGKQFTAFLRNGGKLITGEPKNIPISFGKAAPPETAMRISPPSPARTVVRTMRSASAYLSESQGETDSPACFASNTARPADSAKLKSFCRMGGAAATFSRSGIR